MAQFKLLISALLLLLLELVIAFQGETCPAKEDIYPCTCSNKNIYLENYIFIDVECRRGSIEEFKKAFDHLRSKKGVNIRFKCESGSPCSLIASMLWDLNLEILQLQNVELEGTLDAKSWEALSQVSVLYIQDSPQLARELSKWDLGRLKNLKTFNLWLNNMTEISNEMFRTGPKSLIYLSFLGNEFQTIGDEAFASLTNLKWLWIQKSGVRNIQRSMLPKEATNLSYLDFRDNKLSSLPEDIFDGMPSLRRVELAGNSISQLPAAPWSTVWEQLTHLELRINPLVCDSYMKWMFTKSRPKKLYGKCRYPEEENGKQLSSFIDENS